MKSMTVWKGWLRHLITVAAGVLVAGLQFWAVPAQAGYELPPGERITNLPHIPRAIPQKEAYETYDPSIGRNFDIKNFWMRADLRVRPEFRRGTCFGGGAPAAGACNSGVTLGNANARTGAAGATNVGADNDFYVQQWVRLGIGYDLSPDVNFYMEIIDAATWGANGNNGNAGNNGDPLNHACGNTSPTGGTANCRLGVRAAYVLVRNLAGVQGLSMKAGRQYVIFGNHSLFGHFDWANTGYSHDGIMFNYNTKNWESWLGWFRNSETDIAQGAAVGSIAGNVGTNGNANGNGPNGTADSDMFIFYNQVKNIPGILFEPYYVLYINNMHESAGAGNGAVGPWAPKAASQIRHMFGQRTELRKGGWDAILETAWQTGRMADGQCTAAGAPGAGNPCDNDKRLTINAWALRSWLGYTFYESKYKPRIAVNVDYASGDGNANCTTPAGGARAGMTCKSANTFENFFPTNHIHMGYMDIIAWRNMFSPSLNYQMRPSERDHFEFWWTHMRLASARDNWYRAAQGPYVWSSQTNTANHIGDELDFSWTRMFADGKVSLQTTYGHMFAGSYIAKQLGTSSDQSWGFVQLWMNF